MAARTWFTPEKNEGLTAPDCAILNRAARNQWATWSNPSYHDLMALRMTYRPGMSAAELLEAVESKLSV